MKIKYLTAVLASAVILSANSTLAPESAEVKIIRVKDSYNREVTLPSKIKRIGCLYAFSGHVVTMLGRGGDIVAVVKGLKRDKILTEICPSILNAAVPNLNDDLNMEEIARVKPDLVFIKDTVAMKKSNTDKLTGLGIPYVVISFNTIEEQKRAVLIIGKSIGRERKAQDYIDYYNKCKERVKKIVHKIPEQKKVRLYHSLLEPLKTDGQSSISAAWMTISGVKNVSLDKNSGLQGTDHFVNIEQVLLWNPEVIVTHEDSSTETIKNNLQWSTITAVKTGRVYRMPNGISRWGHPGSLETPLAMLWTVKTIYPEYSAGIDMNAETKKFYKQFFNYPLSGEQTVKILEGRGMRKSKKEDIR